MLRANTSDYVYEVYRMLPPGAHSYYFSINGEPVLAKEQLQKSCKKMAEEKMYLNFGN